MVSTTAQRKRYRDKYPEKVKEQKRKYLDRKIKNNPELIEKANDKLRHYFNTLTRILFNDVLPKWCAVCGTNDDLHIHHKRYVYPINETDLVRLCRRHHVEEHQKVEVSK